MFWHLDFCCVNSRGCAWQQAVHCFDRQKKESVGQFWIIIWFLTVKWKTACLSLR